MTDREALLAAIHADPDDDTRAWSMPTGCRRTARPTAAEFIRLQIEAARAEPFGLRGERPERARTGSSKPTGKPGRGTCPAASRSGRDSSAASSSICRSSRSGSFRTPNALFDAEPIQTLKLYRGTPEPKSGLLSNRSSNCRDCGKFGDSNSRRGCSSKSTNTCSSPLAAPGRPARTLAPRQPRPAAVAGGGAAQAVPDTSPRSTSRTTRTSVRAWRKTCPRATIGTSGS